MCAAQSRRWGNGFDHSAFCIAHQPGLVALGILFADDIGVVIMFVDAFVASAINGNHQFAIVAPAIDR